MPDEYQSGSDIAVSSGHSGRRRARPRRKSRGQNKGRRQSYAALDLGTNNCRLLIARDVGDGFKIIDSYSRVVRLGRGLAATGRLSDSSMDAAIDALGVCARKMKSRQVKRWRCIATEACRKASNGEEFLQRVKTETGLSLEIISPRVEARLSVMGCLNLIDASKDVALVVDIGGGSTELSWVDVRKLREDPPHRLHRPPISAWASLPVGVVTLSELIPERDDRESWYQDMCDHVRQSISDAGCSTRFRNVFQQGQGHLIGTSGTVTSLAGIHLKLPYYERAKVDGKRFPSQAIVDVARDMGARSFDERAQVPCIGRERAALLVAGCAIVDVLCDMWPSEMIHVADRGLREGMLIGLMEKGQKIPPIPKRAPKNTTPIGEKGSDHAS